MKNYIFYKTVYRTTKWKDEILTENTRMTLNAKKDQNIFYVFVYVNVIQLRCKMEDYKGFIYNKYYRPRSGVKKFILGFYKIWNMYKTVLLGYMR